MATVNVELIFDLGLVSCGGHFAASCDLCPQGWGASWCNGDCAWDASTASCIVNSKLIFGNKLVKNRVRKCVYNKNYRITHTA